jgi:hypothetical protein
VACHLEIDAEADQAHHFDAEPDPDFYLMWIRIHVTENDAYGIHPDPLAD